MPRRRRRWRREGPPQSTASRSAQVGVLFLSCLCATWRSAEAEYDSDDRIETARLYGNINAYAYYFTDLLVGMPNPQRVSVIVDTGSALCGFPCEGCQHCGKHIDPPFNFDSSKSACWIQCGADCFGNCESGHCSYTQRYTEGSSISGLWFRDLVQLGDAVQKNPPVNATLGCHSDERKLFYTQRVNGIMGMAPHEDQGRPTILQDLFADRKHLNTGIFSMCLSEWGGKLSVGGYEPKYHVNAAGRKTTVQWIPLVHRWYYRVSPMQLEIGDVVVSSGPDAFGTTLVDSGTTFTYFPTQIFQRLAAALVAVCSSGDGCRAKREGVDCWRLDGPGTEPRHFPTLAFVFQEGVRITWPPTAYLFRRGEPTLWCQAFADNGAEADSVFGVSWMLHKDIIFDLTTSRLGIAEAACPEHHKIPGEELSSFAPGDRSRMLQVMVTFTTIVGVLIALAVFYAFVANHCGDRIWPHYIFCDPVESGCCDHGRGRKVGWSWCFSAGDTSSELSENDRDHPAGCSSSNSAA